MSSAAARLPIGAIERAFQLAPKCESIREVRKRLKQEHFEQVEAHIQGSVVRQLQTLLATGD